MKHFLLLTVVLALLAPFRAGAQTGKSGPELDRVLDSMDRAADNFRNLQADFAWDQYQKVINETDQQTGTIYFRRDKKNSVEMAADIREPSLKKVVFTGGMVRVYEPKIDRVTEYSAAKNRQEFESFLVLGFGGRGHDLAKSFDVSYVGTEQVQGQQTSKLLLIPKSDRIRGMFEKIYLWIDTGRGISLQQQFLESSGDYRLSKYSNIKMNTSIPESTFKLQTTGKTQVVRP